MTVKIDPAEGYGAHRRSVQELSEEVQAVRNIAETAAGGGIEEAPLDANAYLRSNGGWVLHENVYSIDEARIERLIDGASTSTTQYPSGSGNVNRLQIEFGPSINTGVDPVQLDNLGRVTVNRTGLYRIKVALQFGRSGSAGTATILFRVLVNGVQAGRSVAVDLQASSSLDYFENDTWITLPAGVELTFEIMRDPAGNDSGGLRGLPSVDGWNSSPSAAIRIERLIDS